MMIARNDELKRSRIWRVVTISTTILIVVIACFFIMKLFMSNPMEGTWEGEDSNLIFSIKGNNTLTVTIPDVSEDSDVKLKMNYTLDKEEKRITIKEDPVAIQKVAKASDGDYTEDMLKSAVGSIVTTFDYSIDGKILTLTEREYGEQIVFIKK